MPSIEGRLTDVVNRSCHASAYNYALSFLGENKTGDVLDVGTGDGSPLLMSLDWAEKKPESGLVIASDANFKIMADIRRSEEVSPLVAKDNFPFKDNTFDLVISSQVIEHIPRDFHLDFVRNMVRVVKPRSPVIISTIDHDFPYQVKGHKDHIAEISRSQAEKFIVALEELGTTRLMALIGSDRFLRGQMQRARYWRLRPIKDIIPKPVFDNVLRILTRGEIQPNLDMREDFWIKPIEDVLQDEIISDFIFVVNKT